MHYQRVAGVSARPVRVVRRLIGCCRGNRWRRVGAGAGPPLTGQGRGALPAFLLGGQRARQRPALTPPTGWPTEPNIGCSNPRRNGRSEAP
jgi:hypothetical protein